MNTITAPSTPAPTQPETWHFRVHVKQSPQEVVEKVTGFAKGFPLQKIKDLDPNNTSFTVINQQLENPYSRDFVFRYLVASKLTCKLRRDDEGTWLMFRVCGCMPAKYSLMIIAGLFLLAAIYLLTEPARMLALNCILMMVFPLVLVFVRDLNDRRLWTFAKAFTKSLSQ